MPPIMVATCRPLSGWPSQSVQAQNFSMIHAHWPAGESTKRSQSLGHAVLPSISVSNSSDAGGVTPAVAANAATHSSRVTPAPSARCLRGPGTGPGQRTEDHRRSPRYLRDFTRIAAEETTMDGIVARMVERYPDWENLSTLWYSARSAVERKGS